MKIGKVVDFRTFHKLNEAEGSGVISAVDQIVNIFFSAYGALVTKIGGYSGYENDLIKVAESKPEEKGKAMLEAITKVSSKVDPKYKEAANEMTLAGKKIQQAYEILIGTDEGKKQLENINDKIYRKIIDLQKTLKSVAADVKDEKTEIKDFNSINYNEESALFEKFFDKTFTKERNQLVSNIAPMLAQATELAKNSPTENMKTECKKKAEELNGFVKKLSKDNEKEWEEMKRRERVDELKRISDRVNLIPNEIQEIQTKTLIQLGIDRKIQSAITSASEAFTNAMVILNKEVEETIDASAEKKEEETKKDAGGDDQKKEAKEESKEEIVSGTIDVTNLKKAGKNREAIRDSQKKMNILLPEDSKIKDDGLYGKNTEKAVRDIASQYSSIAPEIKGLDGKKMTPEFRKFLDNFEKNKEKIAELFK
jgi:hypothetical protein